MIEVAVGSLPSNVSLEGRAVRDMAGSETDCSEGMDEVALGRIASLPLEPFPPRDFRGKFKKMRHKKRPTILESRYCFEFFFLFFKCPAFQLLCHHSVKCLTSSLYLSLQYTGMRWLIVTQVGEGIKIFVLPVCLNTQATINDYK